MATNTYVSLYTTSTTANATSVAFNSFAGYTDLIIIANGGTSTAADLHIQFNGDSTSGLYSRTILSGDGTSATSLRQTSVNYIRTDNQGYFSTTFPAATHIINIMNYSNTTTYKTVLSRTSNASTGVDGSVGLWRNTAAITSITLFPNAGYFTNGSTFTIYGVRAEGVSPAAKATGGAIYSDATYYYHVFGATSTFTPTQSISADILVIAGGASGGFNDGGGGGSGGLVWLTSQSLTATGYTCSVGGGGAQATVNKGNAGTTSQFGALQIANGGGGGGSDQAGNHDGNAGGSGGGGSYYGNPGATSGGGASQPNGYANVGGGATGGSGGATGGGGGAGGAGQSVSAATGSVSGNGGLGLSGATLSALNQIGLATGTGVLFSGNYYFAGGGGGSTYSGSLGTTTGGGGLGGTGAGDGYAGSVNTGGGGGGGGGAVVGKGGTGGSGIIVVRYTK